MKHLKYLSYVLRHKWFVFIECCKLGIPWRGLVHDLSKFLPSEWYPYVNYFYGDYPEWAKMDAWAKTYYTGKTKEDCKTEFDYAWLLHQKRNKHHWQFWILRGDQDPEKCLPMPLKYQLELLADWNGARLAGADGAQKTTKDWYLLNKDKMQLHPDTREWIEKQLGVI